jgi:hypothetical protein
LLSGYAIAGELRRIAGTHGFVTAGHELDIPFCFLSFTLISCLPLNAALFFL